MPNNKIIDLDRLSRFKDKLDIELDKKANVDGNYPTMTVGSADNLTPYGENSGVEESTPFVFQSAGGSSDIGSQAQLKALRGNSVAFNQLILKTASSKTANNVTFTNNGDGSWTISTTAEGASADTYVNLGNISVPIANQKVLLGFKNLSSPITGVKLVDAYSGKSVGETSTMAISTTVNGITTWQNRLTVVSGTIITTPIKVIPQFFNLSKLGKEYSSVLDFNRDYPKTYYTYNAGELLSCKSNGYKTVGYNACSGIFQIRPSDTLKRCIESEIMPAIAGQTYVLEKPTFEDYEYRHLQVVDENGTLIRQELKAKTTAGTIEITLNDDEHYLRVQYWYYQSYHYQSVPSPETLNTCVHLKWDGSRTGYEPYESNTYLLPNIELRSAGNAYDELKPDGTLIRRIGVVDLGSLNWSYDSNTQQFKSNAISTMATMGSTKQDLLCSKYSIKYANENKTLYCDRTYVIILDSAYTDATTFKTAMSGVYLYYELATPTTEQTEYTFAETTPIDDYGTQEFLYDSDIDIPIPQGNEFFYPVDYKAFIDSLGGRDDIEYDANEIVSKTELESAIAFKELESSNIGAITSSQVVAGEFYKNNIAITGGLTNAKYVIAVMSNGNKYPMIITSSLLVTYSGTSWQASNLTVTKIYYKE